MKKTSIFIVALNLAGAAVGSSFKLIPVPNGIGDDVEAMSGNGRFVVVRSSSGAYLWDSVTNKEWLLQSTSCASELHAHSVTNDGTIAVGTCGGRAVIWTQIAGVTRIPDIPDSVGYVSGGATAERLCGTADGIAFEWTQERGFVPLSRLLPDGSTASASGVNWMASDMETVVGWVGVSPTSYTVIWRGSTITYSDVPLAASLIASGDAVAGLQFKPSVLVIEKPGQEDQKIYPKAGDTFMNVAGISSDGTMAAGYKFDTPGNTQAYAWTKAAGLQPFTDFLKAHGLGAAVANWQFFYIRGVSDDGKTVVGMGRSPDGIDQAFIVQL